MKNAGELQELLQEVRGERLDGNIDISKAEYMK